MTKKLLLLVASQLLLVAAFGQPFSRQEADSMFHALEKSQPDLEQVDLLLHLAQFHIFKPGEFQADFDTAMIYVDEAKVLNKTLKSSTVEGYLLLTESYLTKERGQHDEARKMAEKAVTILESGNNNLYLGSAYYELASYYNFYDDVQRSKMIHLVEKSIKLFQQARNTKKKARALEMLGELYFANNENRKAIQVLMQALAAYDSLEYQALQGVYVILGRAYRVETDYGQALFYLLKALKTAHALGDSSILLCNINHALGELYTSIDRSDLAVKYAEAALEVARQYANENDVFFLSVNLAIKCDRNGQPEQGLEVLASIPEPSMSSLSEAKKVLLGEAYLGIYLSLGQYDKVPPLIEPLLTLVQGRSIVQDRGIIHRLIATYYFQRHQYSKARDCLMKNREPIVYANYKLTPIHDALLWYKLDSVQGNFYSAFNHLLFYKTKMDSILSENRVRQLQVLSVEYETALKEDSIKLQNKNILLLTQQNSLQQANLQQANLLKNVTIGGTAVAFAIMGLLYRLYRQKQKSNNVITQKNEQLQHFLTEKEWLLKEIHHRVKNNLQIVMSLLNSQSSFIDNEPALTAIHDSQHRVHAISLIHQKLYNTENVSSIDISFYIRELVSYLSDCFNTRQRVRFELDVERLEIDVGQAVPLGLILNEAITNAIKYAFPDGRDGVISISLTTTIPQHFELTISDNGIGIPHDFDAKKSGSLGLNLIAGLSEDLEGDFSIESNSGTTLKISFVHTQGIKGIDNVSESLASVI